MINSNQTSTRPWRPRGLNLTLLVITVLSFLGFADAAYLTADHYISLPLPCAVSGGGCETVLTSQYATVWSVPVSILGILYYLLILFLAIYIYTSDRPLRGAATTILAVTTAGLIASCFFFYLQVAVIHSICLYCLGSALTTVLLFISSLFLLKLVKSTTQTSV